MAAMAWPEEGHLRMAIVAGIVQILVALILIFFNFGPTDLVVLLAGALGVAGGLTANKGLMIGSMLCCIFAGIIYGIVSAGWLFMGEEINHPSNTSPWFYEEDCYGPNGDLNMEENCKLELMFLTSFMFIALIVGAAAGCTACCEDEPKEDDSG